MSLHSGFGLAKSLEPENNEVSSFVVPAGLSPLALMAGESAASLGLNTVTLADTATPGRELLFFYRQLSLLAQKMLEASQVSIWLAGPGHPELVCSHVLGGGGQMGQVLQADQVALLDTLVATDDLYQLCARTHADLWHLLVGPGRQGCLLVSRMQGPDNWHGLLCCYRAETTEDTQRLAPVMRQLAQLAERGLDALSRNTAEQDLLLRQQQLDRVGFALRSKTGRAFFDELVQQLHLVFQAREVWMAELESPPMQHWARVMTCAGVEAQQAFVRYLLTDTPCNRLYHDRGVNLLAGRDATLPPPLQPAPFFWALSLSDGKQQVIGHLVMTFEHNEPDHQTLSALQQLISHRASAELERLRAEGVLRLSAVAFETNEGIIITDPEMVILRVNRAFSNITGLTAEQAVGKRLGTQLWPEEGVRTDVDADGRWQGEQERCDCVGRHYPQWETWTPVRDEWGVISHYVICFEDMSERKAAERQIQNLAYYDDLTGLPNRRFLLEQVERSFVHARQQDMVGALLFIDLDHFKTINDSLGHAVGDWLLQQASMRLSQLLRDQDVLARLGGDEFVMLLPALSGNPAQAELQATLLAEQIIDHISMPFEYQDQILHIGCSLGISLFPTREQTPTDLLKQADTAMYQAKSAGRRVSRLFDSEMQRQADRRLLIHNQLRNALRNNELVLHYQPQHMVDNDDLSGLEALVRWHDPHRGIISPAEFIPIAEETDLIIDIGRWVLLEGCHQFVRWHEAGLNIPQLSVNVSARQFHHARFVDHLHEVLTETGMEPSALNLEITESVVLGSAEDAISKMTELKQLGISFSIDDFGTGYSSLGYLKRLPVDELKIDRSFIQDIPHDTSNMAIVEAVLAMAGHLNFSVTAEGVETRQQLEFLRRHRCAFYQGYLASKPLPADAVERYLQRHQRD